MQQQAQRERKESAANWNTTNKNRLREALESIHHAGPSTSDAGIDWGAVLNKQYSPEELQKLAGELKGAHPTMAERLLETDQLKYGLTQLRKMMKVGSSDCMGLRLGGRGGCSVSTACYNHT
jgi:hypothetical protein